MNRTYYTKELAKLRTLSKEFSRQYPSIAPMLADDSSDPDIERLLEGFAYLAANIQEKLDDEFPELIHALTNIFFPSYLRPVPSAVMLEFLPKENVAQAITVKQHAQIASQLTDGVKCLFRTVAPLSIEPLRLLHHDYITAEQGNYALKLDIACLGLSVNRWNAESLNFYVSGEQSYATDIFYILLRYCDKIGLKAPDVDEFYLPGTALQAKQFSEHAAFDFDALADVPSRYLFRQYLTFPQQFLQIELTNLNQWKNRGKANNFSIIFYFKALPSWFSITEIPHLILNTIPTVNLFPENARSLNLDQTHYEYKITVDNAVTDKASIYAITNVEGLTSVKEVETYAPFSQALNNLTVLDSYQIHYRTSRSNDAVDWYVSLSSLKSFPDHLVNADDTTKLNKTLRLDLLCCNGAFASRILPGTLNQTTHSTPATATFKNLHTPTAYYPMVLNDGALWRILSLLSYNFFAEADLTLFTEILLLETEFLKGYNKKVLERRLTGITQFSVKAANRLYHGAVIVGYDIHLSCHLDHFISRGDLFLLGHVLDMFFIHQIPFNTYAQLAIKINETGELLSWPARTIDKVFQ